MGHYQTALCNFHTRVGILQEKELENYRKETISNTIKYPYPYYFLDNNKQYYKYAKKTVQYNTHG